MLLDEIDLYIHRLAMRIADDATRADIELNCPSFTDEGREPVGAEEISAAWYDLSQADPDAGDMVMIAVSYLDLRDQIIHHPSRKNWIRMTIR